MKWVLIVLGVLVALVALMLVVGTLRPKSHVATITVRLGATPDTVWRTITDFGTVPQWFGQITKAERLADQDGKAVWRESYGRFAATSVITIDEPGRKLVREILPEGAFYGSWTWELAPEGALTRLTITERGTVENPLFRAMMVFHDNTSTMRQYAEALGRRLNAQTEVVAGQR